MNDVHPLKPEPMTDTSFAAFGQLWQAQDRPSDTRILAATDYQPDGQSTVGLIWQRRAHSSSRNSSDISV